MRDASTADRWVIEGIYGTLIGEVLSSATALIWLCPDDSECVAKIRYRGIRRGGDNASLSSLIHWAETYRSRQGSSSYAAHERLFNGFVGEKRCLRNRVQITDFAMKL